MYSHLTKEERDRQRIEINEVLRKLNDDRFTHVTFNSITIDKRVKSAEQLAELIEDLGMHIDYLDEADEENRTILSKKEAIEALKEGKKVFRIDSERPYYATTEGGLKVFQEGEDGECTQWFLKYAWRSGWEILEPSTT